MRKFIKKKISIIIPTYNEEDNINDLVIQISNALKNVNYEIIIVDDGSTDQTAEIILKNFENNDNVKLIQREESSKGLLQSIKFAMQTVTGEYFVVMDGDGQHTSDDMLRLINELEISDFVIGVRDLNNTTSISTLRRNLSKLFNKILSVMLGKTISDPLSGFFAGKISILNKKFFWIDNSGFKILLDLLFSNKGNNIKITEKVINFKKRGSGLSKLNSQIAFLFITQLISYLFNGFISSKFIGFIIIGSLGFVLHFIILFVGLNYLSLSFYVAHVLTTLITATFNYILNNYFNFHNNEIEYSRSFLKKLFFLIFCWRDSRYGI